ncbi:PD-(D/E)XK nuclease-like domain-containing protein [Salmonella enterica subsp. enterica serovar Abeokuta]|uniref:PD-(D/E)XK nuclease-like domain-containing protein n=1 Tax=Salmonella enterica subsp. enterica serovar Abeokuta TaxID=2926665 RepID=A0A8T9IEE8_SALET|nr:RecE family exodeoxyribonuclease [Salmonella enterica]UNO32321.1 PD-(D/E)XK nuclease-like domain-containing protein [Salmonella enterica subsp. enterica serovar Abeokuta]
MSGTIPYFIHHKAKKQSGEPNAVFWESAKSETRALRDADNALEDADKDPANYFKPVVTNFPVVNELPPEGEISFTFCDFYQLGDDGMTWAQIPGVTLPSQLSKNEVKEVPPNVVDSVDTETGEIVDDQRTSEKMHDRVFSHGKLSFEKRVFGTWLFGLFDELSKEQLSDIVRLELDMDATYAQNVMLACRDAKVLRLQHVFPETLVDLFAATKSVWPEEGKAPMLNDLITFFSEWIDAHTTKSPSRDDVTAKWNKKFKQTPQSNDNNAPPERYKRAVSQTTYNLNVESCVARMYPDAVPGLIKVEQLKAAKDLIESRDDVQTKVIRVLSHINDILDYDALSIFGVTRSIDWSNCLNIGPVILRDQARTWLAANGIYENGKKSNGYSEWEEDSRATRHSASPSEEKAELVTKVADGVFDVSALLQNSATHGTKKAVETIGDVQVQEIVSDEKQAGNAIQAGENDLGNSEEADTVENQNQAETHQNNNSVSQSEPESQQNVPDSLQEEPAPARTWPEYFEPGRYEGIPNEVYHAANGISSTMLKDVRISPMYYYGRHIAKTIPREQNDAMLRGTIIHSYVLEPEKFESEFAVPEEVPEEVVSTSGDLVSIIKEYNAGLPSLATPDELKAYIEEINKNLTPPLSLSGSADETANLYMSLPVDFQRIPDGTKHTAAAQKACIKEYNASLQPLLKVSGTREQLLDQIATIEPEYAEKERAKFIPYNVSGTKEQLTEIVRTIRPDVVTADDWHQQQEEASQGKTMISLDMYTQAKNISAALQAHPTASKLLNHPSRQSEVSYFGFDEETGLEIRVRPDLEITLPHARIGGDLKSISLAYVKMDDLKARLHREIINRDYHLSAAMYCDTAELDQFFWIFVNREEGYHWIAVVEASPDLLELGRKEYRKALRTINACAESNQWPAPITEDYTDELNDFDLRRLEALGAM